MRSKVKNMLCSYVSEATQKRVPYIANSQKERKKERRKERKKKRKKNYASSIKLLTSI